MTTGNEELKTSEFMMGNQKFNKTQSILSARMHSMNQLINKSNSILKESQNTPIKVTNRGDGLFNSQLNQNHNQIEEVEFDDIDDTVNEYQSGRRKHRIDDTTTPNKIGGGLHGEYKNSIINARKMIDQSAGGETPMGPYLSIIS